MANAEPDTVLASRFRQDRQNSEQRQAELCLEQRAAVVLQVGPQVVQTEQIGGTAVAGLKRMAVQPAIQGEQHAIERGNAASPNAIA